LKKCNVAIIVLDTLREDYSAGLENLVQYGFQRLKGGISPSSWTLPSHVSMLTGELPSVHGVHERLGVRTWKGLPPISKAKLGTSSTNLSTVLKRLGYKTYCVSSNPLVSPEFGFLSDEYHAFSFKGDITMDRYLPLKGGVPTDRYVGARAPAMLKTLRLRRLVRGLYSRLSSRILGRFGVQQMEKGSKYIKNYFERTHLDEPFFAFVNLMEAHEPYIWNEKIDTRPSILGKQENLPWWRDSYPLHAKLAVSRALRIVLLLLKYDPLVIVTSDHGQLLGEGGRYGHGFFLDDELVKVPLYVRFPGGKTELESSGQLVSLTETPRIVECAIDGEQYRLGSDYAISESFGSQLDLKDASPDSLRRVFARRTRVFCKDGSITYNQDTGVVEDATKGLTSERIQALKEQVPVQSGNDHIEPVEGVSAEDEARIRDRLRELGYE
jgi:hypothetical protein